MSDDVGTSDGGAAPAAPTERVTQLLHAAAAGDPTAPNELFALIYDQLRAIAQRRMAAERAGHTLQATALVNEVCLRLLGKPGAAWAGRTHFFGAAAQAMRQILIDHARARNADKRGGARAALAIASIADLAVTSDPSGFLALDDAILRLEQVDALAASVVRLRFYAGLSPADVAQSLGASERTVRRQWAFARGWLRDALERECD
jgi:RNA polymerase sigma factor (TIGR02999 family)